MLNCYVNALLSDQSKYLRAYSWWDMGLLVSSSHTLESRYMGSGRGNHVISHHANVLIVEDNNILWHLGPSGQTGSMRIVLKCKEYLI